MSADTRATNEPGEQPEREGRATRPGSVAGTPENLLRETLPAKDTDTIRAQLIEWRGAHFQAHSFLQAGMSHLVASLIESGKLPKIYLASAALAPFQTRQDLPDELRLTPQELEAYRNELLQFVASEYERRDPRCLTHLDETSMVPADELAALQAEMTNQAANQGDFSLLASLFESGALVADTTLGRVRAALPTNEQACKEIGRLIQKQLETIGIDGDVPLNEIAQREFDRFGITEKQAGEPLLAAQKKPCHSTSGSLEQYCLSWDSLLKT